MAHGPILVRPSPPRIRRRGRRPRPMFRLPTWADFSPKQWWPSILNQRRREILGTTKLARRPNARNPSSLHSFPRLFHEAERERERERELARLEFTVGTAPPASPLAGVRRSPEGERATIKLAHCSALRCDRSRHVDDPTSGGGHAARGPSQSVSSLTTANLAMEVR
jgi:hypothetical protein